MNSLTPIWCLPAIGRRAIKSEFNENTAESGTADGSIRLFRGMKREHNPNAGKLRVFNTKFLELSVDANRVMYPTVGRGLSFQSLAFTSALSGWWATPMCSFHH